MGEPAKYAFDRCFDTGRTRAEKPEALLERRLRLEFDTALVAARKEAFEQGRTEGEAAARKSLEADLTAAAGKLARNAEKLLSSVDDISRAESARAMKLAHLTAERLAGELLRRYPAEGLTSIFTECLEHAREAPHLAIRVNDTLAEALQQRVTAIAAERGYAGRIVVLGDPETRAGDCRIEWADGGVTRDFAQTSGQIADAVDRYLNTRAVRSVIGDENTITTPPAANGAGNTSPEHNPPVPNPQGVLA